MPTQSEKAQRFRALHHGPEILLLANAWDCASARVVELAGYPAVATGSAGVAFSLGYPDGQRIPREEMLAAVHRIARTVDVPVSADLEGGYGDVALTTEGLIDAGAAGLNLEDIDNGLIDLPQQVERIRTVRRIAESRGVPIVLNARTDLYLEKIGDEASRFGRALERLHAFIDAGADCLFVPGIADEPLIARFTEALNGFPLNILATKGTPPLPRLKELGVARVSVGSGLARAALAHARRIAIDMRTTGGFDSLLEQTIPYAEINAMFGN